MAVLERIQATIAENRGTILLLVGLFLLLNPQLTAGLAETDADQYGYESFQITVTEDGTLETSEKIFSIDSDAACLDIPITRACILEQAVYDDGGIVYAGPSSFIERSYSYVYVHDEGFFEPVERERSDGRVHYGHDPVDASTAMDRISTPIDRASVDAREAIEQGTFGTTDEIRDANELIQVDGEYYVVDRTSYDSAGDDGTWVTLLIRWLPGLLGFGLLLVGHFLQVATDVKRVRQQ
ncbi:hypothetical protein [Halapricum salinum]|uniref:Uncharacterized protein n=1 Tax=Halapricum salinum TaxID=1457250 RepID=A0A4D6HFV5_9EURY|nr:hypothetical protein [Halapricum salinum]QCC52018.1 hypothetical protein DV733_12620 [Halapricum salinum]